MSHIEIDLPELPQEKSSEQFNILLSSPSAKHCKLGEIIERAIEVTHDIGEELEL